MCSYWTTETKDDSSFSVIGSSLGEFAGKLKSFQLSCFASEFTYTRKEQKKFQSLMNLLKILLKWKLAFKTVNCIEFIFQWQVDYELESNFEFSFPYKRLTSIFIMGLKDE